MDFDIPEDLQQYLAALDGFIESEIVPLQARDDNERFFDHRREHARTDWDNNGWPRQEWEALLGEMRLLADAGGHYRFALPAEIGGSDGTNLQMAIIREHLATRGLGLHNDLQNESSIVGNHPFIKMMLAKGNEQQKAEFLENCLTGKRRVAFGLTEPNHGSDATHLDTSAVRDGEEWVINGAKRFNTGMHHATHDMVYCRTSGEAGDADGITCFLVPTDAPGVELGTFWWTFNMPTDHPDVFFNDVRVGDDALFGELGRGLELANMFVHENRIRQAASSLGAAQHCIDVAVEYAKERKPFGKPLWLNQAIQFPLAELQTEAAMLRALIRQTAWQMDRYGHMEVSDQVSMCNYRANRLVCNAADQAMQTCGGIGYTRHMPFEHIYRHHRRYRITEGAEEIQIRRVAGIMFGKKAKR
ncbi:MAG: acyl-CoA dehydrogenase family protein [Actinomycetia bacterium]|nr:acyl-CoA dehydrogenase family protein [Actinomycetes bacterium]MCP4957849.1 acyl-CoA dehydrogenase family protein [Actinomycetes bacterium]